MCWADDELIAAAKTAMESSSIFMKWLIKVRPTDFRFSGLQSYGNDD
jgi:hypothetical protein